MCVGPTNQNVQMPNQFKYATVKYSGITLHFRRLNIEKNIMFANLFCLFDYYLYSFKITTSISDFD